MENCSINSPEETNRTATWEKQGPSSTTSTPSDQDSHLLAQIITELGEERLGTSAPVQHVQNAAAHIKLETVSCDQGHSDYSTVHSSNTLRESASISIKQEYDSSQEGSPAVYEAACNGQASYSDNLKGTSSVRMADHSSDVLGTHPNSDSDYEPYDNSDSLTDNSDDEEAPSRSRHSRMHGAYASPHMQQSESTSAVRLLAELASACSAITPDLHSSSAVSEGEVGCSSTAASTSRVAQAPSILPEGLENPNWLPPDSAAPIIPPFTAQPGVTIETARLTSPMDFFELFVTEDLCNLIVHQTNLYAQQFITANPSSYLAKPLAWKPLTMTEFKTFLGLTLLMGIVKKNELRSYWSRDPIHYMSVFPATMTRTRYEMIMRFMHFNDNNLSRPRGDPQFDQLHKIRPLINYLSRKFAELYKPQQNICVGESLIHFTGKCAFEQYIPNKRGRYGVRLFKLCERASGYTYSFRVFEGNDTDVEPPGCPDYMGSRGKVVWDLVSPLFQMGYHLYVDDSYTSVPLFRHLYSKKVGCCGTVRPNRRGFPQQLVNSPLRKGEKACLRNEELLAVKWRDRRDLFMMSTIHPDKTVRVQTASGAVEKPLCVHEYNLYMGGVDFNDQRMKPYLVSRKARHWYKNVSIYLFQLAEYNAFILHKGRGGIETFLEFQESIVKALLYPDGIVARSIVPDAVSRLHERHFPDVLPSTPTQRSPQKRCRVCSRQGIRRDTRTYCPDCPNQPGLCVKVCFRLYHTLVEY